MKKLLFATAIAASAAAFAAPLTAVDFEGANDYQPNESGSRFYFDGTSNSSVVSNDANAASTTKRTANFAEAQNANYLALDTEGGTLWRSINDIAVTPDYGLGTAEPVASTGTYLDTLVQFTVTEDDAPTVGEDDKLAIWLQAGEGTTNLMVRAAIIDDGFNLTPTNFVINNASVEPGIWYRLTVKAIADATDGADGVMAFQIFLDGNTTPLKSSLLSFTDEYIDLIDSSYKSAIEEGSVFVSLQGVNSQELQGVGFQGTGAVDEIVWTEEDPLPAAVVEFTLTYSGDANTTLGAVTYTIGEDPTAQTPTEGKIPDGASVSIAAPTFAAGYQLAAFTVDGTAVASPTFPYTFTMTANTTVAITAELIPVTEDWVDNPATDITAGDTAATAYPGLAGSALATADAQKLTVWAKANNIAYNDIKNDTTGTYTEAYLLNCAVADVEDEKEEFVANITIGANGTPVVTAPAGKNYNGKLQLKGKVNLTDATWTNIEAASTTYKFYMYELSL